MATRRGARACSWPGRWAPEPRSRTISATSLCRPRRRRWYEAACSGRSLLRELQLRDHAVAHHELLRLAGDRHRQVVDEAHVARHLVVRNLVAAEVPDLVFAAHLARLEH